MKLEYVSAFLLSLFLMSISVPNLFAEDNLVSSVIDGQNTATSQDIYKVQRIRDVEEEDLNLRTRSIKINAGNLVKYGVDLISLPSPSSDFKILKLRSGVSGMSKNAAAGVQVILSW